MAAPILEIEEVDKFFGPIDILHDISPKVHGEEVLCLLGDNGAGKPTLIETLRGVHNSKRVKFLCCAPHTFYFGDDTRAMLRECADVLSHVHVGDTVNHRASSGLRYILNPPGTGARVHQHLDIGQGEVPWDDFFGTLAEVGFDGIMTSCVFAWEDRADASGRFMRSEMQSYIDK